MNSRTIIQLGWLWAIISSGIFIIFGGIPGGERSVLYRMFTGYILQDIPLLISSYLCFKAFVRNKSMAGSSWLLISVALVSYFVGNVCFASWDIIYHLNPTGSLGDPFYVLFYILIAYATLIIVFNNKVRLNILQWGAIALIGMYVRTICIMITTVPRGLVSNSTPPIADPLNPSFITWIDLSMKPYGDMLNVFYLFADGSLLLIALALVFSAWQKKYRGWQLIAQAIACFYIADIWFAYASLHIPNYQNGFVLEVFWIFGAIQFGIAASLVEKNHVLSYPEISPTDL